MSNVHSTPFALPGAGGAVAGVWPPSQPKAAGASLPRRTGLVVRLPVRSPPTLPFEPAEEEADQSAAKAEA